MSEVSLKVSKVTCSYEDFTLEEVDFNLESGEMLGLVGKSGSGKSTLLRAILGIKKYESGSIWAEEDGDEISIQKISGFSPQENSLYPFMSINENLDVFGRLRGVDKDVLRDRRRELLKELKIFEDRKKPVSEISGGMKKRTDLACVLLHDPDIIFLDEPFSGIDPPQRNLIWKELQREARNGKIVIITSHLIQEVSERCNKYGLIHDGKFYRSAKIQNMMVETNYNDLEEFLEDSMRF